jgi:hypothetical protein
MDRVRPEEQEKDSQKGRNQQHKSRAERQKQRDEKGKDSGRQRRSRPETDQEEESGVEEGMDRIGLRMSESGKLEREALRGINDNK